jgi:hypothetical protein
VHAELARVGPDAVAAVEAKLGRPTSSSSEVTRSIQQVARTSIAPINAADGVTSRRVGAGHSGYSSPAMMAHVAIALLTLVQ